MLPLYAYEKPSAEEATPLSELDTKEKKKKTHTHNHKARLVGALQFIPICTYVWLLDFVPKLYTLIPGEETHYRNLGRRNERSWKKAQAVAWRGGGGSQKVPGEKFIAGWIQKKKTDGESLGKKKHIIKFGTENILTTGKSQSVENVREDPKARGGGRSKTTEKFPRKEPIRSSLKEDDKFVSFTKSKLQGKSHSSETNWKLWAHIKTRHNK